MHTGRVGSGRVWAVSAALQNVDCACVRIEGDDRRVASHDMTVRYAVRCNVFEGECETLKVSIRIMGRHRMGQRYGCHAWKIKLT